MKGRDDRRAADSSSTIANRLAAARSSCPVKRGHHAAGVGEVAMRTVRRSTCCEIRVQRLEGGVVAVVEKEFGRCGRIADRVLVDPVRIKNLTWAVRRLFDEALLRRGIQGASTPACSRIANVRSAIVAEIRAPNSVAARAHRSISSSFASTSMPSSTE
jgi:hypothetical protein